MRRELYRLGEAYVVSGGDDAHLPRLPAPRVIAVCFDGNGGIILGIAAVEAVLFFLFKQDLGGLADVKITKDAAGTRVTSYDFIPTVIHFSGPIERVMPLDTYTDELAAVHHVNLTQPGLTVAKLRALWHSITGR